MGSHGENDIGMVCRICSGCRIEFMMESNSYRILKCLECGLEFVDMPSVVSEQLYGGDYFTGEVYQNYFAEQEKRIKGFTYHLEMVNRYVPSRGDLLEIGCAAGFFLVNAARGGWRAKGIEVSPRATEYGRKEFGLDITCTDIDTLCLEPDRYDVVVLWDVIEHLKDPFQVIEKIQHALRKGGFLFLSTGNTSGFNAWFYGSKWYLYAPPHHLWYFSHTNMTKFVKQLGFQVVRCASDGNLLNNNEQKDVSRNKLLNHWRIKGLLGAMNIGNAFTLVARKG